MEMEEQNGKAVAKRLWKIVRIVFHMCKTGMYNKSKLMLDLSLMLKRGNRAITSFHHRHNNRRGADVIASLTACRSSADADVISSSVFLREYEFSCSNSPRVNPFAPLCRRKRYRGGYDDAAAAAAAVQRVFELLGDNGNEALVKAAGESPLVVLPAVRVTDSPFPVKDDGGDGDVVDKAAEEFIKRFYKNLKLQKKMTTGLESPYYGGWDR